MKFIRIATVLFLIFTLAPRIPTRADISELLSAVMNAYAYTTSTFQTTSTVFTTTSSSTTSSTTTVPPTSTTVAPTTIPQAPLPGDATGDNRLGLDDVIYLLQVIGGARASSSAVTGALPTAMETTVSTTVPPTVATTVETTVSTIAGSSPISSTTTIPGP